MANPFRAYLSATSETAATRATAASKAATTGMATTEAATSAYAAATEAAAITKAAAVAEAGITARSEIGIIVEAIVVTALTETAVGTASAGIGIPVALRSAINISMRSIYATRIVYLLPPAKPP